MTKVSEMVEAAWKQSPLNNQLGVVGNGHGDDLVVNYDYSLSF